MSYEVGAKTEWADGRLRLNGAAFFSDYSNIQTIVVTVEGGTIAPRTETAGEAEVKGFELEMQAIPVEMLRLDATVGYLDTKYTSLEAGSEISIDNVFQQSPKWTYHLGAELHVPLGGVGTPIPRVDYSYKSSSYNDPTNSPGLFQKGFGLLNARLTLEAANGDLALAVYGTNLTDEAYVVGGLSQINALGFDEAVRGRPREYGVSLSARF